MGNDEEFLKRLKQIFSIEADENLKAITESLIKLEKETDNAIILKLIEEPLREVHSLKGSARSVNIPGIITICQHFESVLLALKKEKISLTKGFFDISYEAVDLIKKILSSDENISVNAIVRKLNNLLNDKLDENPEQENKTVLIPVKQEIQPKKYEILIQEISKIDIYDNTKSISSEIEAVNEPEVAKKSINVKNHETVRISVNKLDAILYKTEDMLSVKLNAEQRLKDLKNQSILIDSWEKDLFKSQFEIKKIIQKISKDYNIPFSEFSKINEIFNVENEKTKYLKNNLSSIISYSEQDKETINDKVTHLLEDIKKTLMFPFSSITDAFPRMVRDIASQQVKDIDFVTSGTEIEIDKRILEDIKDPLIHLIRNSIDHGIENSEERLKSGKENKAKLKISIFQTESNKVNIIISDDGRGINKKEIIKKAISLQLLTVEQLENMSEKEVFSLIFSSGFSTSPIITELSGRGLGLAIVKEKVEKLGGVIDIETTAGKGTSFKLTLPLTLATFKGLIVKSSGKNFVIPLVNVEQTIRFHKDDIKVVESIQVINLNGKIIPIVNLSAILRLPVLKEQNPSKFLQIVIICTPDKKIALSVDEVLYEQEVMIKSMGKQLSRVSNVGGITILGSGKIAPLLNVSDLIKTSENNLQIFSDESTNTEINKLSETKSILIAEDSITSRTLLKNILETAGYNVKTTVDGQDAFTVLLQQRFDLVISDVEMPRMNGFELTEKIRSTNSIADIPVILITSLSSQEHKRKGIEAGANAYIVKTEFEQENLLEIIPRVIL